MKKTVSILFILSSIVLISNAQNLNLYVQTEAGVAVNNKNTLAFRSEIGANYKWLDVGISFDRESNSFFKEYNGELNIWREGGYDAGRNHNEEFDYFENTSLQLVSRVDIIRLFKNNSRHAFKIGGGYGLVRYRKMWSVYNTDKSSDLEYNITTKSNFGLIGSFKVNYEYEVIPKLKVGAYFGGSYYPSVGLLFRKDF